MDPERPAIVVGSLYARHSDTVGRRTGFLPSGYLGTAPGGLPFFARFNANKNFRSEQLNGYELGYRHLLAESFFFDASFFYNNYSGLFSEDIIGAPFLEDDPAPTHLLLPAQFGNGLRGTTKGVEIAPEWKPTSFWRVRSSYSYLQMNLEKSRCSLDIGSAPVVEGSSPKHEVTVLSDSIF
jgi:iron complex outermembrane receptor protein